MVSVVIPVYNGAKYIEKTIHTILNSTYQDLEIIAVVDGSPDNSLAVCQKLSQEDARVKTFYKEDGYIRLQPENDTMDPIIVPDCQILGKVFGVFRFFR